MSNQIEKVLYTAKTHTTGGRDGQSRSSDGHLDIKLTSPGVHGHGTNPEQLFAAGWSACFIGAIGFAAAQAKIASSRRPPPSTPKSISARTAMPTSWVRASTSACRASIANLRSRLVETAHQTCPYSKAVRGNINVVINLV